MVCSICNSPVISRPQKVRDGDSIELYICSNCDYEFFLMDPSRSISENNLDKTRLEEAGLEIPDITTDFKNGIKQSQEYVNTYLKHDGDADKVLEIGCSWGYFLSLLEDRNYIPYGLEINKLRCEYVNEELKLKCYSNLSDIENNNIKFKHIYLFYIFEYVSNPLEYLKRLLELLDENGRIIIITPNLNDGLKDIWNNKSFQTFFYDKHAINYFSTKTLEVISKDLKKNQNIKCSIKSKQGYSIINHIGWFLNNKPSTTGKVGGDYFMEKVESIINDDNRLSISLKTLIEKFNNDYKMLLENDNYGNQIEYIIQKN